METVPTSRIKVLLLPSCFLENSPGCTALSSWVWQGQLPVSLWSLSGMGCPPPGGVTPTSVLPLGVSPVGSGCCPFPCSPGSPPAAAPHNLPLPAPSAPAAWQ